MKIILTGGGTGGHTFPLIAILREIKKNSFDLIDFLYLGPKDQFAYEAFLKEGIETSFCNAGKIRRYGGFTVFFNNFIDLFFVTPIGIIKAFIKIYFYMPDLIFSKGGYGSFPVIIAGTLLGVPIILHESDVIPGKTNKTLASFAFKIYTAFPEKNVSSFPLKKMIQTGNPIRENILNGSAQKGKEIFNLSFKKPTVLFLGGSQGSVRINDLVIQIMPEILKNFEVIHQTGSEDLERVKKYARGLIGKDLISDYHAYAFLNEDEIKNAYAVSDIIVARAGSGTIFEISANGKPSILIPLPEAAQNHQLKNALTYAKLTESAIVIEEKNLTPNFFLAELKNIFQFKNIKKLGEQARQFSVPNSAEITAKDIIKFLES